MTDYTTAQSALNSAINNGVVEEYEASKDGFKVKRGPIDSQIRAAAMLEGLVHRRSSGMFRVAKLQEPTD